MANKVQGYGFSKEVADKINQKYSDKDETEINNWFQNLGLGQPVGPGKENFQEFLQDGQILCKLANTLQPDSIRKVHNPETIRIQAMKSMKCQENISFFFKMV